MTIEYDTDVLKQLTTLHARSQATKRPTEIPEQKVKADIARLMQNKEINKAMTLLAAE